MGGRICASSQMVRRGFATRLFTNILTGFQTMVSLTLLTKFYFMVQAIADMRLVLFLLRHPDHGYSQFNHKLHLIRVFRNGTNAFSITEG